MGLTQVGISCSPLSNNHLFKRLARNPFADFFYTGLNVTLSTDDPLQFHNTDQPLLEEYTVQTQLHKFNPIDLSEIARNSVLQSGLTHEKKQKEIGEKYEISGALGNDEKLSAVPDIRTVFRHENLVHELSYLFQLSTGITDLK